ncbi:hypothetical protein ABT112_00775 [Streptomyces sp. NPDC002055]|uniref:hypothetical protein n=1 Tax=Streptomyces sp. NPDC002055 TaxID=3154534 RepID=UPI0033306125
MNAMRALMSLAAAGGVLGAALGAAQVTAPADAGTPVHGPAPAPAPPAAPPVASFDYGAGALTESLAAPRAGICYSLGGTRSATAFRNGSELRAELFPEPGCAGRPSPVLSPGRSATGVAPRSSVVFVVGGRDRPATGG